MLNEDNGIEIIASSNNTIGGTNDLNPDGTIRILHGNVISGNAGDGVRIKNISEHNLVEGDYIGTNTAGEAFLGNAGNGVEISFSEQNTIGGTTPGARNVISDNFGNGISISTAPLGHNLVVGNYIGADPSGTPEYLGNAGNGIEIGFSDQNMIGGTTLGAGNLISGNSGDGIRIVNSSNGNLVEGNYIGTDESGTQSLGNAGNGIEINFSEQDAIGTPRPRAATSFRATSVTVS